MKRISVEITDELESKLQYVCTARGLTKSELIRNFVENQYQILNENSAVHQTLEKMEALAKELEELQSSLSPKV